MVWIEFFHGSEDDKDYNGPPLFKEQKTNMPKDHNTPQGLKTFINSVRSELLDPKSRNRQRPNLPPEELKGLKEIIQLQKEKKIVVRAADKGAGIVILSFSAYMDSCFKHLNSVQKQADGTYKRYYQPLYDLSILQDVKENISEILKEGLEKGYITQQERDAMEPGEKQWGRFYEIFKLHKPHEAPNTPPERPIISCSGSVTENIGRFVKHHLKNVANKHESYLQDTPDFLREVHELNKAGKIRADDVLCTIDVSALYTNIDLQEGLEAAHEALEERDDKDIPSDFIMKLLEIILKFNIFEFDKEFYIQLIGVAMGCVPAVSFANIFMAKKIDPKILEAAMKFSTDNSNPVTFLKRFIDDIFMVWRGSIDDLHKFLKMLNQIHPTIKFTASHTTPDNVTHSCDCPPAKSIPFLDTSCSVSDNNIKTTLFKKPTDRNQYLLPSSCHPAHVTENIPYSLALRIVRICSDPEDRESNFQKLKQMLLERDYKPKIIDAAINRARLIKREDALKKVVKTKTSDRPVFSVLYDPRLPSIRAIVNGVQ